MRSLSHSPLFRAFCSRLRTISYYSLSLSQRHVLLHSLLFCWLEVATFLTQRQPAQFFFCYPFWVCVSVFFFLISLFLFCSVSQFSCATFGPWLWQREDPEDSTQGLHLKIIYCATAHTHTATHTNTDTNYLSLFILVLVERTLNCWPKHLTRLWSGRVLAWLFPALFKNCLCFTRATTSFFGQLYLILLPPKWHFPHLSFSAMRVGVAKGHPVVI